jgi:hypothetical protein
VKNIPGMEDFASTVLLPPSPNFNLEDKRSVITILFFPLKIFEKKKKKNRLSLEFLLHLHSSQVFSSVGVMVAAVAASLLPSLPLHRYPPSPSPPPLSLFYSSSPFWTKATFVCVCVCEKRCIYQCWAVL